MTLDMESPLFLHHQKLAPLSPPPQQHDMPAQHPRISFSIAEILKPDFGSNGNELRTATKDGRCDTKESRLELPLESRLESKLESTPESKLSPESPPLTPTSPVSFTKDSLQSYYQLYQQRYAQYVYQGFQFPHFAKLSPPPVHPVHQPLPYGVLPANLPLPLPQAVSSQVPGHGQFAPLGIHPHPQPHFPAQDVPPQRPSHLHRPHHPHPYARASPPSSTSPPQLQPPQQPQPPSKRPPSPPPQPSRKKPSVAPAVKPPRAPSPTSPPSEPAEPSVPAGEGRQGDKSDGEGNGLWPAWVYCTRYSDRPSAGPRSRKMKRREKSSASSADEKRPRTAFTNDQLDFLRREFEDNKYLTEERRQRLAKQLELTESQIKIWFQNKRAKLKKSTGAKNALTMSLIAQGLYNHTAPSANDESSQASDGKLDSS